MDKREKIAWKYYHAKRSKYTTKLYGLRKRKTWRNSTYPCTKKKCKHEYLKSVFWNVNHFWFVQKMKMDFLPAAFCCTAPKIDNKKLKNDKEEEKIPTKTNYIYWLREKCCEHHQQTFWRQKKKKWKNIFKNNVWNSPKQHQNVFVYLFCCKT